MEKYDAFGTCGVNFAYNLLAKRLKAANRTLNLPFLKRANIAAEPIAPETLEIMVEAGFPRAAINPTYGMAETCVYVCDVLGDEVTIFDGNVCLGLIDRMAQQGTKIVVADRTTKETLEDGNEGELFLNMGSLASGYWQNPEASKAFAALVIDGRNYYATGDLGKIVDGRLYVSGRSKELIIINGT